MGKVKALMFDAEGCPFIEWVGTKQDVADAVSIYMANMHSPLNVIPLPSGDIELREPRED